jgi:spermidine synthase
VAVPAVLALALALPTGVLRAAEDGRILLERETEQQYVQVVEESDGDRILELNEGQAIHSLYKPGSYLTGRYWDGLIVLPFAALDEPPERVAILGNAAGTAARMYGHYFPAARVDGVEIDPELTEIGEQYFDLGGPNLHTHTADARPWLRQSEGDFDVIVVDAYRQPYIPFYLATREFFDLVAEKLAPGGVVVVNVGHPEGNDDLEQVVGRTMAESFSTVVRDPVEDANTLLLGSQGEATEENLLRSGAILPDDLTNLAVTASSRIGPRLPGGEVYTDDRAPVEWLIDKSILGYAGDQ